MEGRYGVCFVFYIILISNQKCPHSTCYSIDSNITIYFYYVLSGMECYFSKEA